MVKIISGNGQTGRQRQAIFPFLDFPEDADVHKVLTYIN